VRRALRPVRWSVVACLAVLFLAAIPELRAESTSVTLTDGSVISAWEVQVHATAGDPDASDGPAAGGSALYYSISGASGTLVGAVHPTEDAARDTQPTLAVDPSTGSVALLWSRFDGVSFKIAYARLDGTVWTDFHILTFARTGEFEPRVGSSSTGSYLFWLGPEGGVFYAPVDLAGGRLLAAGTVIRVRPATAGGRTLQSGTGASTSVNRAGGHGSPGRRDSLDPGTVSLGADSTDGPNPPGNKQKPGAHCSFWRVHDSAGCRNLILVVPDASLPVVHVILFVNGTSREIGRTTIPYPVPDRFADDLAAAYMNPNCQ
jgi:hypothetical protein